jgi:hypothetical protein
MLLKNIDFFSILTSRIRSHSFSHDELTVKSGPANWPGVDSLIALLSLGRDEEAPNLRLLLVKTFFSVSVSLFCYALAVYDARWLYRLCARDVNSVAFGQIFGGAGEKNIQKVKPPNRPPRKSNNLCLYNTFIAPSAKPLQPAVAAANTVRANLHAKVFGADELKPQQIEQTISCWVPPKKHIIEYFAEKVEPARHAANEVIFDSDASESDSSDDEDFNEIDSQAKPHKDPNSYAWLLIRFACVIQHTENLRRFLSVAGFEQSGPLLNCIFIRAPRTQKKTLFFRLTKKFAGFLTYILELVSLSPHIDNVIKLLNTWSVQLQSQIEHYPQGCPMSFLPSMYINTDSHLTSSTPTPPLLRKYRSLVEHNNTPFEYTSHGVLPVKRLWAFLVRQETLSHFFIRHIFAKDPIAVRFILSTVHFKILLFKLYNLNIREKDFKIDTLHYKYKLTF